MVADAKFKFIWARLVAAVVNKMFVAALFISTREQFCDDLHNLKNGFCKRFIVLMIILKKEVLQAVFLNDGNVYKCVSISLKWHILTFCPAIRITLPTLHMLQIQRHMNMNFPFFSFSEKYV